MALRSESRQARLNELHGIGWDCRYNIKKALAGAYQVRAKYFSSSQVGLSHCISSLSCACFVVLACVVQQSLTGATTLLLSIYRYYATEKEQKSMVTMRLQGNAGWFSVLFCEMLTVWLAWVCRHD
jgi:hypothetical protein